jgi:hypothetical protein
MKTIAQIMALLTSTNTYGKTRQPSNRPMYPYVLWEKAPRSNQPQSPSYTKKGPGRCHRTHKTVT